MAGLVGKVGKFLTSPQGRRLTEQVQRAAKDPATRRRITDALSQLRSRQRPR